MAETNRPRRSAVVAERLSILLLVLGVVLIGVELLQFMTDVDVVRDPGTAAAVLLILSFVLHRYAKRRARRAW